MSAAAFESYRNFMTQYVTLNPVEWALIRTRLRVYTFQKGETIHAIGDIPTHLLFIHSGLARAMILDEHGRDYTWSIFFNDETSHMSNLFVVDYDSFMRQTPSLLHIEALETCECVALSHEDVHFFYRTLKKGEQFGRMMTEAAYSYLHNTFIDRQSKSAAERFEIFMATTPHLLDKVPQYHIASYLGITPQYLSRLKKEYASNPS